MELAMVGLGKMGSNMVRRLRKGGHRIVGYDRKPDVTGALATEVGMTAATSLPDLVASLQESPRAVWVMVPAGPPVESVLRKLSELLAAGDIIVDGGNSNYKHTLQRAQWLADKDIHFVDVGTSGGVWGLEEGYSMMVGGPEEAVAHIRPALESLAPAPRRGWGRVGPNGAGHFVKMVHNGVEYGIMQAYAEGFELMGAKEEFALDLHQIAEIWRFGSVVRSWLLDLTALALEDDYRLLDVLDWVADSGEGRWTVAEAIDLAVPTPVIALSLMARFSSRQESSYAGRLLAALRHQFGGHEVRKVADV